MLKYHGLSFSNEAAGDGSFYFGVLRLLHGLPIGRGVDIRFLQTRGKFQDTFWKLDRAAQHVAWFLDLKPEQLDTGELIGARLGKDVFLDLPLFLDLVPIYLRVMIDAYAQCLPAMYARRGILPDHDFNQQRQWFIANPQRLDTEYAAIVGGRTDWFDRLRGDLGLRDLVIHYRGTHQIVILEPDPPERARLDIILHSDKTLVRDYIQQLKAVTEGMFSFFDRAFEHQSARLAALHPGQIREPSTENAKYYEFVAGVPSSGWLYPMQG